MTDIQKLLQYGKKRITLEDIATVTGVNYYDTEKLFVKLQELVSCGCLTPVNSSGLNSNNRYPMYKKYNIVIPNEVDEEAVKAIKVLHPILKRNGYLSSHPNKYSENKTIINKLNKFFFNDNNGGFVSRKERSFDIFGQEKILDNNSVKNMLANLDISENELRFYDTPEYCFHDYIISRKEHMTLLICENKDIWFNIRRCMFERGFKSLFGIQIDGVVYGNGNKISQKQGALTEYVKFMGNPDISFLYWGDIDREGFDIFRRTKQVNPSLKIELFVPGYQKMISRAKNIEIENSPSTRLSDRLFVELLSVFSQEEKNFVSEVLEQDRLIPQEIISYIHLTEEE